MKEHRHGEAYRLMTYRSDDGTEEEMIWNSRDGVTPFSIVLRSGKSATHADWSQDIYAPHFRPVPGMRIFVDVTPERRKELAREAAERHWDHPMYPASKHFKSIEELAEALESDYRAGDPDLIEVDDSNAHLYSGAPRPTDQPADLQELLEPYRGGVTSGAARQAAITAVHALEAREADPSVEQYVDAVLSVIPKAGRA